MALATGSPYALNSIVAEYFERLMDPAFLSHRAYRVQPNEIYVSKGFMVDTKLRWSGYDCKRVPLPISSRQMDYLKKILKYARAQKAPMVLVTQPLSREYLDCAANYKQVAGDFEKIAKDLGVPYYDFNGLMNLDSETYFADSNHLNSEGVKIYNELLIDILKKHPAGSSQK